MADAEAHLPELPDDVIVVIFSHLPSEDLLGPVRAVCRRWRALAAERQVWRDGGVRYFPFDGSNGDALTARALSLPLYLRHLQVYMDGVAPVPAKARLLTRTPCVVEELRVELRSWKGSILAVALRTLRHLEPHLRRLWLLEIPWAQSKADKSKLRRFLQACFGLRHLTDLRIDGGMPPANGGTVWPTLTLGGPSLKKLRLENFIEGGLVAALLTAHSATLVGADLGYVFRHLDELKALAGCSQMSDLRVPAELGDVPKALVCLPAALTHLAVACPDYLEESYRAKRAWARYFSTSTCAERLTSLTFTSDFLDEFNPTGWRLVLASLRGLASSSFAALRVLTIDGFIPEDADFAGVLAGLPQLEEVSFGRFPEEKVLDAVLEEAPPRLHTVRTLYMHRGCRFGGALQSAGRLVQRHPRLHVVNVGELEDPERCREDCCDVEVHRLQSFGVVAREHPPSRACALCVRYSALEAMHWIRVNS